jgi:hypothetical protein
MEKAFGRPILILSHEWSRTIENPDVPGRQLPNTQTPGTVPEFLDFSPYGTDGHDVS